MLYRSLIVLILLVIITPWQIIAAKITNTTSTPAIQASIYNRPNARLINLTIPAPRGAILDRKGRILAKTVVAYRPTIQIDLKQVTQTNVVRWVRRRLQLINKLWLGNWQLSDETILKHYRQRRWLPYQAPFTVTAKEFAKAHAQLLPGISKVAVFLRHYPYQSVAAHIIGYTAIKKQIERSRIVNREPLFAIRHGSTGIEKSYNQLLSGSQGQLFMAYGSNGELLKNEITKAPQIGGNVVLSIDITWQQYALNLLKKTQHNGAFVIIDVTTGEIITLASNPSFNLNLFIPHISLANYQKLLNDPSNPLFARSYQGSYSPASCFKMVTGMAALSSLLINQYSYINCPASIQLGKHTFWNWSREAEGTMNIVKALARSNNCFFYILGKHLTSNKIFTTATNFGYGQKTGIPLASEAAGTIPNAEWFRQKYRRSWSTGDHFNHAIGQGSILATPLQIAYSSAIIARSGDKPQLTLIKQLQNHNEDVLSYHQPSILHKSPYTKSHIKLITQGMIDCVNSPYGTGKRASLSYAQVAGKTGTAQWSKKGKITNLAWFTGFFPAQKPRYAFAVLYEGKVDETVSGGRNAAPIARDFFEHFATTIKRNIGYKIPPKTTVKVAPTTDKKAVKQIDEDDEDDEDEDY